MLVEAVVPLTGTRAAAWALITDIERAASQISGILGIEMLERPATGLLGTRWRETRLLFGKPATAEKEIIAVTPGESYTTRTVDAGFEFLCTRRLREGAGGLEYEEIHDSRPQTFLARVQAVPMGLFFKGVARKAILQDLLDIQNAVARGG